MTEIYISVIIPILNEEESVKVLYSKIKEVMKKSYNDKYEIIFVDDGSTDGTYKNLEYLFNNNDKIKIIRFYRNFGKAAALTAGFEKAKGRILITMDGDLQDDPNEIPKFIKKIEEGYDLVNGWKFKRKDPITKTLPSKLANFVTSLATGINIHDMNCGFKAYRKEVTKKIKIYGDMHRYIPTIVNDLGFKITEIKVEHHKRLYGKSKYGFFRLFRGLFDFITIKFLTKYKKRPMHFFGMIGGFLIFLGLIILSYLSILKLVYQQSIGGRPMLMFGILLLIVGVQFFSMGLIGEIIINVNQKKEETYTIRKILEK